MTKRMVIMLAAVGILFGGIFGYKAFMGMMMKKYMSAGGMPPVTVSTVQGRMPGMAAADSRRWAACGPYEGSTWPAKSPAWCRSVHFKSGDEVKAGQLLVQLNVDSDIAQLQRAGGCGRPGRDTTYERDKKQLDAQAISQATLDADAADLKVKQAQVAQQEALVQQEDHTRTLCRQARHQFGQSRTIPESRR